MPQQVTEAQVKEALRTLDDRKTAYQIVFGGGDDAPAGRAVLTDLARFCRANESCWNPDPRIHAALEGRREVWLRIQEYLRLPVEELLQKQIGDSFEVVRIQTEDTDD